MSAYIDLNAKTKDILDANGGELTTLIDKAIFDMISDTMSRYKDSSAPRKITIELALVRIDDQVNASWKVTPKPAPYEKIPEPKGPKVPDGQTALELDAPEADPATGEILDAEYVDIFEEDPLR